MAKEIIIDIEKFKKQGFYALEDTTKAPLGSLRIMRNAQVTDRGGLGPRPGTQILGSHNSSSSVIRGFYNFRKSFDSDEFLIKAYDDEIEVYSKNHGSDWWRLKSGFTADKEFGFVTSLVNTDNEDYVIYCNRYEPYSRWQGSVTMLNGALVGGETAVIVDSLLTEETFESQTATSSSATTLDVSSAPWAASQWVNMYVYIPSTGKIRKITANTTSQITFDTLGGDPGSVAFQIRKLAFPATGTIIYGGTTIAYTAPDVYNRFPVSSAHAAADNTVVALVPTEYAGNPRGNRFTNYLARIVVGNVRSALARDTGGALQGYSSAGSAFISKINTPTDFSFSATRVAGEGDILSMPYGGGDITDVQHQEDSAYVFKKNYIESVSYSQDANDLAVRAPLKAGIGSVGKTIKASDDIYFITGDKQFTSIGRVKTKDIKPETMNLGNKIKRFLDTCDFGTIGRGKEINSKIYIPLKSSSSESQNNQLLVYNKTNDSFEGIWDLPAFGIEEFDSKYYYAESNGANVHQMFIGNADVVGTDRFPIYSQVATHFMNLTASKSNQQAMNCLTVEGYVRGGSEITFEAWKDFSLVPFLSFNFATDDEGLLDGEIISASLGGAPLAVDSISARFSDPDLDGRRHFFFIVYFPFQYGNFFSVGHTSNGADFDYEVTRYGLGIKEDVSVDTGRIKNI